MSDLEASELVRTSSPELLAHLLVTERADRRVERSRHQAEIAELRTVLDQAQRIGINVLRLARAGRKTVRLANVMEDQK